MYPSLRTTLALVAAAATACAPPPPLPEDRDAAADGAPDARGPSARVGAPCTADSQCGARMRCLDSLSAEGAKYCAPECAAGDPCTALAATSYAIPITTANAYGVEGLVRGVVCAPAPGASAGSASYCQFACGSNQFYNESDGEPACNCLPDFERRREGDRAFCVYSPQSECSIFRGCTGTPQCGSVVCAITRSLQGVCVDTTGASVRGYIDCILGSTDCDGACLEGCLSAGAGQRCSDACCRTRPPEPDAGTPDASAPDASMPDSGPPDVPPSGRPDLQIERASWFFTRPTASDTSYHGCLNANPDGSPNDRGNAVVVVNRGTASSSPTVVALGFVNAADEFQYGAPTIPVPALAPGERFTIAGPACASSSFATPSTPAGTYRAATYVDPTTAVSESDETNNLSVGTYTFTWDPSPPSSCRPCTTNAQCGSGESCLTRRCDGRRACYAAGGACTEIVGVACTSASLWDACVGTGDVACPRTSDCIRFMGGTANHCAPRCTTNTDCAASPNAAFDGRTQACGVAGYCIMPCTGTSDTCPGATRCVRSSSGSYQCM